MAVFQVEVFSVPIALFEQSILFGSISGGIELSSPLTIEIEDDDGILDPTDLAGTNVTRTDIGQDQGAITEITFRTISVVSGGETVEVDVAVLNRSTANDYLLIPINGDDGSLRDISEVLQTSGYNVGDLIDLPNADVTAPVVNSDPVAEDDDFDTDQDTSVTGDIFNDNGNGFDDDPDGDDITLLSARNQDGGSVRIDGFNVILPSGATLRINPDGTFIYNPAPFVNSNTLLQQLGDGEEYIDGFTYTIGDGNGGTSEGTVAITVTGTNDAPRATIDQVSVDEDASFTPLINVIDGTITPDFDPEGGALSVVRINVEGTDYDVSGGNATVITMANGAVVRIWANGDFLFAPSGQYEALGNQPGQLVSQLESFTYTVADEQGLETSAPVRVSVTGVNDAPVAEDDEFTVDFEGEFTGQLVATDAEGDALTFTVETEPANGSVIIEEDGSYTYTPDDGFSGIDSFTYLATDPSESDLGQVVITASPPPNRPPVVDNDFIITDEDTTVQYNLLDGDGTVGEDTDPDGDELQVTGLTLGTLTLFVGSPVIIPDFGTITVAINGDVTFIPDPILQGLLGGQSEGRIFGYTISDGNGETATGQFNVDVNGISDAPIARDDVGSADEGNPVVIDVLANDSDVDTDNIQVVASVGNTGPTFGSVIQNVEGDLVYTADDPNFSGTDRFSYVISDGSQISEAFVDITINPVNDAPEITSSGSFESPENVNGAFQIEASDIDSNDLTFAITGGDDQALFDINADTGVLSFKTAPDFEAPADQGEDNIYDVTVEVSDGELTDEQEVQVEVTDVDEVDPNSAPTANDDDVTVDEDSGTTNILVLENDTDPEDDELTITIVGDASNGTAVFDGEGGINYTPDDDFNGEDSFTYTISDGEFTSQASVNVTVNAINDAPVVVGEEDTVPEDGRLDLRVTDLLANDSDVDGDPLEILSATALNGEVEFGTPFGGVPPGNLFLTYFPNDNYNGPDTITYVVSDGNGGQTEGTIQIDVTPVNDNPVAVNDEGYVTDEDTPLILTGLLDNDTDVDGDTLTIEPFSSNLRVVDGDLVFTPAGDFNGTTSAQYLVRDGNGGAAAATVEITVLPVNDAPNANNSGSVFATGDEGSPLTFDPFAGPAVAQLGVDIDGDALSLSNLVVSSGEIEENPDGTLTFTPVEGFSGDVTFSFTVSDGQLTDDGQVSLRINDIENAPVAGDDSATTQEDTPVVIDLLANDSDPDGDPLTVVLGTPSNGEVVFENGEYVYTPDADFNGQDSFTYEVSDGNGGTDQATVTVTVEGVNDAPEVSDAASSTDEDTPLQLELAINAFDVEGDNLTFSLVTDGANGSADITPGGLLTYTPDENFNGADSIVYQVDDGNGGVTEATFDITVNPVNDDPVANDDTGSAVGTASLDVDVLANDTDVDGDVLSIADVTGPAANVGTAEIVGGQIRFTAADGFEGVAEFSYTVSDGEGGEDQGSVSVTVSAEPNTAPVAADDDAETNEDSSVSIDVLGNDEDADGDDLTITDIGDPEHGTAEDDGEGGILYTPDANYNGPDSFTYEISDGKGGTSTATVNVTVTSVNDLPVAEDGAVETNEDTAVVGNALATDVDGSLDFGIRTGPSNGDVSITDFGEYTYTPDDDFNGEDSFIFFVDDGQGGQDEAKITVTVNPVNDNPVANDDAATTDAGQAVDILVLSNDTDVDQDTLSVDSISSGPANGMVDINADGSVTYTPDDGFDGQDSFTYDVSDGQGGLDTATVTVQVDAVDPGPNVIMGDDGLNNLIGTDGDDLIISKGGRLDKMTGGEGADDFLFGSELANGAFERDIITDFEAGIDSILLSSDQYSVQVGSRYTLVTAGEDNDQILLYGRFDNVDDLNISVVVVDDVLNT